MIQRCLNMREISKSKHFHNLIQKCHPIINRYQTEFSYIHFPLVLSTPIKHKSKYKQSLFKKRSQSESHIEYDSLDLTKDSYRKSCDVLIHDHDDESDTDEQLHHRDHFKTTKQNLSNNSNDNNQKEKIIRHSSYYTKLKIEKPKKYSRQQEHDSDDENYRELDHIYDYIRSGDITDDVQKIQAKEQALNVKYNQENNNSKVCALTALNLPNSTIKVKEKKILSSD